MSQTFALRRSRWAAPFIGLLAPGRLVAEVGDEVLTVRMGLLGRAEVPLRLVDRLGKMSWPWWGGLGVRLGRNLVAFVASSGPAALVELSEPIEVRAPLRWRTSRIAVGADDTEGLIRAMAQGRARL